MLSRGQKIAYGVARFGSTLFLSLFGFAGFYVYWDIFKLDPVRSGWINAAGKLTILVAGTVMGYVSDSIWTKWGKRKPFIITGAPMLAISGLLYFVPDPFIPVTNKNLLFYWGAAFNSLFHFFYGYLLTPYQAWMPEITEPGERIDVSALQNVSNILGNVVGIVMSFAIPSLIKQQGSFLAAMATFAAIEVAFYMPCAVLIPVETKTVLRPNVLKDLKKVLTYREYMLWEGVRATMSVSETMISALIVSYVSKVVGVGETIAAVSFGVILLVFIAGFFKFWGDMAKKVGKGPTLVRAGIVLIVGLLLAPAAGLIQDTTIRWVIGYLAVAVGAIGLSAYELFPYAVVADLAHWDEIRTGENRAGLYTGFESIPINMAQSLAYILIGYITALPSFPGKSYTAGLLYWAPIAALFVAIALAILRHTNIDPFLKKAQS
ncbi:MAG: hypothetical protein DRJ46_02990 [Thermoprotei archaeon]|nr:MAG: hypothetical protein DRJ46_02990 [Thermoprotei archaeon]